MSEIIQQISIMAIPLLLAIILHEVAHGWVANRLGDPTARMAGRLTLNPLAHIDPIGTLLLPGLLILSHSPFLFGYAKPVPVNFQNLRNPKRDMVYVAAAGAFANFLLAFIFSLLHRFILLWIPLLTMETIQILFQPLVLMCQRLVIHGINRHEHFWRTGRTVTRTHMMEEIRQMKRMNINAVRTCHYPDMPEWYDLCDQYGILLICECNVETHGVMGGLTQNPAWAGAFCERSVRMVQNYKNHVSIYSWSLGNESGTGVNHAAMYGFIKEYDPTRLCQYEAGSPGKTSRMCGEICTPPLTISCAFSVTRRTIVPLFWWNTSIRSVIAAGGSAQFIALTEKYPRFQGGYIWDWQDKCVAGR